LIVREQLAIVEVRFLLTQRERTGKVYQTSRQSHRAMRPGRGADAVNRSINHAGEHLG
jgi:hypothetical protein